MSHKIKILAEDQYSNLIAGEDNSKDKKLRLYIASLLPGLFYAAADKIRKTQENRFVFIPSENIPDGYSWGSLVQSDFSRFEAAPFEMKVGDNLFVPLLRGDRITGGYLGRAEFLRETDRQTLTEKYPPSEFIQHLYEINSLADEEVNIAPLLLDKMSADKSFDSFMSQLPEWIVESIGGGSSAYYYGNERSLFLRKSAGGLAELEGIPSIIKSETAQNRLDDIRAGKIYSIETSLPDFPAELNYQPMVNYTIGGSSDRELDYIITGRVPDITSLYCDRFIGQLRNILERISQRHFASIANWRTLISNLDKMARAKNSIQDIALYLYEKLNESIIVNHLSISRFYQLENRIEIEGLAAPKADIGRRRPRTFSISGTMYEEVIETGQARFDELSQPRSGDRIAVQLYESGIRSHLILPIQSLDSIYGFLSIGSSVEGTYLHGYQPELDSVARFLAGIHESVLNRHKIEVLTDQLGQLHNNLTSIENMRTLGELAGGVFHDLNNVIGAILGRSQLILQKTESKKGDELIDRIIKDATLIEKSALDSGEILKRLRQLARSERKGKKEPVELQVLIDDSIEMIQPRWERLVQRSGLKITLEKEPIENTAVTVEASEMREVFTNLFLNALDAMPEGGRISIVSRRVGKQVRVTISDTGTGMTPEVKKNIFTPFYTTKGEKGTGLGLPLSKKIIENHHGHLEVESKEGEGTSFIITLPVSENSRVIPVRDSVTIGPGQRLNILIAEDSPELQATMFEMLTVENYNVSKASSGEEVLKLCGKKRFDILITDLGLPGISGLELAGQIKSIDKNIKIILTSGWEINKSIKELKSHGVDCYLAKPFKIDQIRQSIKGLAESEKNISTTK